MKASEIDLLVSVGSPAMSPDGRWVWFAVTRPDVAGDVYVGQLWRVAVDPSGAAGSGAAGLRAAERMTRGFRDSAPQFSPDGSLVGFLRAEASRAPQVFVVPSGGGEPRAVTDQKLGVESFAWSPDARQLTFVARVPEHGRYGTVEGLSPDAEAPRRITTETFRLNGVGYTIDQRAQVFVVDVPDARDEPFVKAAPSVDAASTDSAAETAPDASAAATPGIPAATQLTDFDTDHDAARFTPDGRSITFVAARHATRDVDLRVGAWSVAVPAPATAADASRAAAAANATPVPEPTELVSAARDLSVEDVLTTADGTTFVLAAETGPGGLDFIGVHHSLYSLTAPGGELRRLTDPNEVDLESSHLVPAGDNAVLAYDTVRGARHLLRVDASGHVDRLTGGSAVVSAATVASSAGAAAASTAPAPATVVVAYTDETTAGDLALVQGGELTRLTDFSAPLRAAGIAPVGELVVETRDGTPVHGWVLTPEGDGPHPTLLVIHGGPQAQYTAAVFDEAQVYVAAGYGVVMCNPRGSAGYGEAFAAAVQGAMGTVDMTDVLDFFEGALAKHPQLDALRVGIMGGSYGGYLTAWTIAHDHRFAASIVERGYLDPEYFIGTSDIGSFFSAAYTGDDPATRLTQSPQAFVDQVRTPTLVMHSENDLRCPVGQAERYYLSLRRAGVETEMLLFPGENHELTRSGRPRHRVQRFDAILEWWGRYLPVAG